MKTYRTLVNEAIRESGVDLDSLLVADFPAPVDPMHDRFKHWVQQAYSEFVLEREQWFSTTGRATITLQPRIFVDQGDLPLAPVANNEFVGYNSGTYFTVVGSTLVSGTWLGGDAKATIDFKDAVGDFIIGETYNETFPDPLNTDAFRIKGWGRYAFNEFISDFGELQDRNIMIQDASSAAFNPQPLVPVPWSEWLYTQEIGSTRGRPNMYTRAPDGKYDFWPRLDKPYILQVHYRKSGTTLALHDDEPLLWPEGYEDAIMWRAVKYYAQFDHQAVVLARAQERLRYWKNRLERDNMPTLSWAPSRYEEG